MPYYMMYSLEIKNDTESDFIESWMSFSNEIQSRYKTTGSTLFKVEKNVFVIMSVWPSKEIWEKFWITKEMEIESLTRLKLCLKGGAKNVSLKPMFSNWHLVEASDTAVTKKPTSAPDVDVIGAQNSIVFFEGDTEEGTVLARIPNKYK